jgi:hypothetical protein
MKEPSSFILTTLRSTTRISPLTFGRLVMMYVKSTQSTVASNLTYCYSEVRKRIRGTYQSTSAAEDEAKGFDIPKDYESLTSFSEPLVQKRASNRG